MSPASTFFGLFLLVVSTVVLVLVFRAWAKRNSSSTEKKVKRGTKVEAFENSAARAKDVSLKVQIAGFEVPSQLESQHFLFAGQTGTGKSQGIAKVLSTVRARGSRAMIADSGGGFLSRLCVEGDIVLNPFDGRSVQWSPFADIREEYDCARIARAAIPDAVGEAREWNHYAQVLLSETLLVLYKNKEHSIRTLLHLVCEADQKVLFETLKGTAAAIVCSPGNERMLGSVRSIVASFLQSWRYLTEGGDFSVRDWVRGGGSKWLFLTYRDDQAALLRPLVATILELAITETLSLNEDPSRDVWFIMDEVDSLGKIGVLRDGLSKLRKYGGKCVLGLQTISQLRSTYGKDEAQTLMANISTKMVLRAGDGETADYFSTEFGDIELEIEDISLGTSKSLSQPTSKTKNISTSIRQTSAVLNSEISGLEDLCGFLKMPQKLLKVRMDYIDYPEKVKPYMPRS